MCIRVVQCANPRPKGPTTNTQLASLCPVASRLTRSYPPVASGERLRRTQPPLQPYSGGPGIHPPNQEASPRERQKTNHDTATQEQTNHRPPPKDPTRAQPRELQGLARQLPLSPTRPSAHTKFASGCCLLPTDRRGAQDFARGRLYSNGPILPVWSAKPAAEADPNPNSPSTHMYPIFATEGQSAGRHRGSLGSGASPAPAHVQIPLGTFVCPARLGEPTHRPVQDLRLSRLGAAAPLVRRFPEPTPLAPPYHHPIVPSPSSVVREDVVEHNKRNAAWIMRTKCLIPLMK